MMQSLKRSLRFRWSSSQMEANLEASDLTATELPPTYLRAFHSLIALDSSSAFCISWFSFWGLGLGAGGWGPLFDTPPYSKLDVHITPYEFTSTMWVVTSFTLFR